MKAFHCRLVSLSKVEGEDKAEDILVLKFIPGGDVFLELPPSALVSVGREYMVTFTAIEKTPVGKINQA